MTDDLIRAAVVIVAVVVLFPIAMMVVFMPLGMMGGVMYGSGTTGWMSAAVLWLVSLVVLAVIGYLLYSRYASEGNKDETMESLRVAYARGNLSKEEFEERLDLLQQE